MLPHLRKIHFVVGLVLLIIFPLTGAYLRLRIPHLMQSSERMRFSMRGNHIYILLASLLHLSLGAYLRASVVRLLGRLQFLGSALLLLSSTLVVGAFFLEPKTGVDRPLTLLAMVMASAGTLLHVVCARGELSQ
jgi:hypothetical protein